MYKGGVDDENNKMDNGSNKAENSQGIFSSILSKIFSNIILITAIETVFFILLILSIFNFLGPYSASFFAVLSILITITISFAIFFYQAKGLEKKSEEIIGTTAENIEKEFDEKSEGIVQNVEGKMKNLFDIIEKSQYAGVEEIMAPRLESESDTNSKILEEVKKTKKLFIFSITGLKFFQSFSGGGDGEIFYEALYGRIKGAKKPQDMDFEIKALLINPNSNAAKFRDVIETYPTGKSNIKKDIGDAEEGIRSLNRAISMQSKKLNINEKLIECQFYCIFPQSGFIMTDDYIFLEHYHYAPTKDFTDALEKNAAKKYNKQGITNERSSSDLRSCTGGRIPLIKYNNNSNVYIAMLKHFETIWLYERLNGNLDKFKAIEIVKKYGEIENEETIEENLKSKFKEDYNPYGWNAEVIKGSDNYKVTYDLLSNKETLKYMVNPITAEVISKQSFLIE